MDQQIAYRIKIACRVYHIHRAPSSSDRYAAVVVDSVSQDSRPSRSDYTSAYRVARDMYRARS